MNYSRTKGACYQLLHAFAVWAAVYAVSLTIFACYSGSIVAGAGWAAISAAAKSLAVLGVEKLLAVVTP